MSMPWNQNRAGGGGGGPILRSNNAQPGLNVMPISELSCYSGRWCIKARVTTKSEIRTFRNARGEGKLFSIDLCDKDSGEIRGSFFGKAVDKFHPMLEVGKVYTFAKGSVKNANKRFNP